MKDTCGFCAPFTIEDEPEIVASSTSSSFNKGSTADTFERALARQLEVILEKEEDSANESNKQNEISAGSLDSEDSNENAPAPDPKQSDVQRTLKQETHSDMIDKPGIEIALQASLLETKPQLSISSPTALATPMMSPVAVAKGESEIVFQQELHKELDFDENPSELYLLLQRRDWNGAMERVASFPEEATYWISRKEVDGKLRWRLLPIHGAIIFCAPETMIKCLLEAYPESASAKDDQGMLPLHLSYRMGSPAPVVEVLLDAFPESLDVKDRKGRTPLVMAQTAKGPNRAVFLRLIEITQQKEQEKKEQLLQKLKEEQEEELVSTLAEDTPTLISSPKAAPLLTSAAIPDYSEASESQSAEFEALIKRLQKEHSEEVEALKKAAEKTKSLLEGQVNILKADLASSEEASQVLSEHVATLERRLKQEEETQTHLATKIATLDSAIKHTIQEKTEAETKLTSERDALTAKRHGLEASLDVYRAENEKLEKTLTEMKIQWEKDFKELEKKYGKQSKEQEELQRDYEGVSSNVRILEEQLKKKMVHEQKLVQQVSSLARQLTVATEDNEKATTMYTQGIRDLQKERDVLRATVSELSKKLINVIQGLEEVDAKQEEIKTKALSQEQEIEQSTALHEKLVSEFKAQQDLYEQARRERAQIAEVLRQQELALSKGDDDRTKMVQALESHGEHIESNSKTRHEIVEGTKKVKNQIKSIIRSVTCSLPDGLRADDERLVDHVIQTILSKNEGDVDETETHDPTPAANGIYTLYVPKTPVKFKNDGVQLGTGGTIEEREFPSSVFQFEEEKKGDEGEEGIEIQSEM